MAPKKATPSKAKASTAAAPQHASYQDMIKEAIVNLKERNGSSRQAVKKYIQANNSLGATTDAAFSSHLARALKSGEENGLFERPKGASGPVKLKKPAAKEKDVTAPAAKATKPKTEKKAATPKKTAPAKKAAPKKVAKAATTTTATKKAAPKTKANAGKPRAKKTPTAAPAVEEKPAVVLGKTKSGRVTKSTAPQAEKKKPAAKKAAPKKKATPKKATPKK